MQNFWSGYKESAEFQLISQYYRAWMWDVKYFSDQAAKGYVEFWDVKSVSVQAAYYIEWRGPLRCSVIADISVKWRHADFIQWSTFNKNLFLTDGGVHAVYLSFITLSNWEIWKLNELTLWSLMKILLRRLEVGGFMRDCTKPRVGVMWFGAISQGADDRKSAR